MPPANSSSSPNLRPLILRRLTALILLLTLLPLSQISCAHHSQKRRIAAIQNHILSQAATYGLIDVRQAIPEIAIDLRYATAHNVTGRPVYPSGMPCLLRQNTAERLRVAQQILRSQGYGLLIWDAWRPPEAQTTLSSASSSPGLFLNPNVGWSRHCGGVSIDATLIDSRGVPQPMPTDFDTDFPNASSQYRGANPTIARNLQILHSAMKTAGLIPLPNEWWHFDDKDHINNPIEVITGQQLGIYGLTQ